MRQGGRVQAVNPLRLRGTRLFYLMHGGNGIGYWDNRQMVLIGRTSLKKVIPFAAGAAEQHRESPAHSAFGGARSADVALHLTDGAGLTRLVGDPPERCTIRRQSHVKVSLIFRIIPRT